MLLAESSANERPLPRDPREGALRGQYKLGLAGGKENKLNSERTGFKVGEQCGGKRRCEDDGKDPYLVKWQ